MYSAGVQWFALRCVGLVSRRICGLDGGVWSLSSWRQGLADFVRMADSSLYFVNLCFGLQSRWLSSRRSLHWRCLAGRWIYELQAYLSGSEMEQLGSFYICLQVGQGRAFFGLSKILFHSWHLDSCDLPVVVALELILQLAHHGWHFCLADLIVHERGSIHFSLPATLRYFSTGNSSLHFLQLSDYFRLSSSSTWCSSSQ